MKMQIIIIKMEAVTNFIQPIAIIKDRSDFIIEIASLIRCFRYIISIIGYY